MQHSAEPTLCRSGMWADPSSSLAHAIRLILREGAAQLDKPVGRVVEHMENGLPFSGGERNSKDMASHTLLDHSGRGDGIVAPMT